VINKPKGLVVHPAPGHATGTLVNAVLAHAGDELSGIGGEERPGIVHRLDRDTSGLILVAKTDLAHESLQQQIAARTAERRYLAVVRGSPKFERAEVDAHIGRHPTDRRRMAVLPSTTHPPPRPALTELRVLERFPGFALLEARLQTGRTHQIRVHCAYIRHPVVGDPLYGPSLKDPHITLPVRRAIEALEGQALHAYALAFDHPRTGQRLTFTVPPPPDTQAVLDALGSRFQVPEPV
jgi:23S rRNA pseudouridine1911/1915/1917 synthase